MSDSLVQMPQQVRREPPPEPPAHAVLTYRYLRIAMVLLLLGIGASVAAEVRAVGADCLQGSISAYYYTPVRAFFVSAVLALGVCLVALRGSTWWEETALNVAGMLAPVVALVPTPHPGTCTSDPALAAAGADAVANNMTALLVLAPACVLYVAVLQLLATRRGKALPQRAPVSVVLPAVLLWVSALTVFAWRREVFLDHGHAAAALLMFGCIVLVVALNGRAFVRKERRAGRTGRAPGWANRYAVLAWLMVLGLAGMSGWHLLVGWDHWVFAVETTLLGLFLLFWTLQTEELWDEGLREPAREAAGRG